MKYTSFISVILLSLFAACDVWGIHNFTHFPEAALEEIQLRNVQGARREVDVLSLQTSAGIVTFKNRTDSGENSVEYSLVGFTDTPNYFYLIRVNGYEGRGYVLVSRRMGWTSNFLYSKPVF
jgi:hypothetical protein